MSEHTPGPWKVADWGGLIYADPDHFITVAEACDHVDANLLLIAAAPDMLAALKEALRLIELRDEWTFAGRYEALDVIRAAIAKAEGEET